MVDDKSQRGEAESSGASTESETPGARSPRGCHETVDPETRDEVLAEYGHRCQACGRRGPNKGGLATLNVHHIERNPDGMDEHGRENLTLLCRSCHSWFHQQSTPDDSPVEITEADQSVLLPQDIEILRYLADNGPKRTGDIASEVSTDLSVAAVRERLWVLMGLDNMVDGRERQIVDKDVETGEWGLTEQVENSARGHIPDDPQLLLQRMEDEQVRQALERDCDRGDITDVLGVSLRTTFNKQKRASAFDFPLAAFSRGGRPPDSERSDSSESMTETSAGETDEEQRRDAVGEQDGESVGRTETWGTAESGLEPPASDGDLVDRPQTETGAEGVERGLRLQLQHVIDALQEVEHGL